MLIQFKICELFTWYNAVNKLYHYKNKNFVQYNLTYEESRGVVTSNCQTNCQMLYFAVDPTVQQENPLFIPQRLKEE